MSETELKELADDILKNGLQERVNFYFDKETNVHVLLDGRNRLRALELLGRDLFTEDSEDQCDRYFPGHIDVFIETIVPDPVAFVISKNIHRRHLTAQQRRDAVAALLKADPEKSNLQIAKTARVDDKTVAVVRMKL